MRLEIISDYNTTQKFDSYLNIYLPQLIRCYNNMVHTIPSPPRELTKFLDVLVGFLELYM